MRFMPDSLHTVSIKHILVRYKPSIVPQMHGGVHVFAEQQPDVCVLQ